MVHWFRRDLGDGGCESPDFPIVCESCLGDNPYVRMQKAVSGKECKICMRPFTVFRWQAGTGARYKKTEICQTCSKLKDVCQVCLLDLKYGLPVQVRDTVLSINSNDAIPKSNVNREYFAEEHDRRARAGIDYESYGKAHPNDTIQMLQRTTPYYKRNKPHVCSFYAKGQCQRGVKCSYRHEMPTTGELSQQNIKDRYYGVDDPVALKLLNKAQEMPSLEPPDDDSIKTLYVGGGLDGRVTEQDLRDHFYAYGEIESIRMVPLRACAFVTYTTREGAEKAAEELSNKLVINGLRLKLMWGRPQVPKPNSEVLVALSGMLPRAVVSQQQSQLQPQDQNQPMHYFNIPPPPQQERADYSSMDPQRMGALVPSHVGASDVPSGSSENKSGQEKQQQGQHYPCQGHQLYPPYGYMPPYQQYPSQYHS